MTRRTPSPRRSPGPVVALALGVALALSACAPSNDEVQAELHASVVQTAERAAAGDFAGALAELALLEGEVDAALEAGRIDASQGAEITAAVELVRADLEAAAAAATPTPTPAPEEAGTDDDAPGNSGDDDKGNSDKGNSGNDDKGKGKGKGKD